MINKQKTRLMTKCAIYEKHVGKEDIAMSKYFKSDYVRINMLKTIIFCTIGYVAVWGVYFLYNINYYIENAFLIDYKSFGMKILGLYISMLAIYLGICWVCYSSKYRKSRARLSKYYKLLGKINRLNEKDERLKDLEEY
ncbi:MAG: hypothetical protein ACI39R_03415 [Lachnospiraceae bacterium]